MLIVLQRSLFKSPQAIHLFQRTMFGSKKFPPPCVMGTEDIMSKKAHGTSDTPVQDNLRWSVDQQTADRICNFNRHYAEHSGYFEGSTKFMDEARKGGQITFYDSNTGKPLFIAPKGRTMEEFLVESRAHGWPSFRDQEVVWQNVRVLPDGETVSLDGTHLGHNLPDGKGSRYCINLVSVAGNPK
jgi:peptide methionine sulfoxide reductase MsrB